MATLLKVDKNGSKHFGGMVKCDRCGGDGIYKWGAMINGRPQYIGTCFKCDGAGKVYSEWIERTPEYQAKLDAKREARNAKHAEEQAKRMAEEQARLDALKKEKEAREAAIAAKKAISKHVGNVGDKINVEATKERTGSYETSFGYQTSVVYVHTFRDADGNAIVWKTGSTALNEIENGTRVQLTGTIKEHNEYNGEKQTVLIRCKVNKAV